MIRVTSPTATGSCCGLSSVTLTVQWNGAGQLGADIVLAPHRNPPEGEPGGPAHRELWLGDPDGYSVVLASPDGEAA